MKENLLILVFWGLALLLLPVVQVSASPAHDHGTVSPFSKQKHGHKLHCDLNLHHLSNTHCPHSIGIAEKNEEKIVIALDCSGKTAETPPTFGSYNASVFLPDTVHFKVELVLISRKFTNTFYGLGIFLSDQIDHPPQAI